MPQFTHIHIYVYYGIVYLYIIYSFIYKQSYLFKEKMLECIHIHVYLYKRCLNVYTFIYIYTNEPELQNNVYIVSYNNIYT